MVILLARSPAQVRDYEYICEQLIMSYWIIFPIGSRKTANSKSETAETVSKSAKMVPVKFMENGHERINFSQAARVGPECHRLLILHNPTSQLT